MSKESNTYRTEKARSNHLITPVKPDWVGLTTNEENLQEDPSGETYHSFFARINLHFSTVLAAQIGRAYVFSKYGHRGQWRKNGERFFNHPRNTTIFLLDELRIFDADLICAALIHDIKEDTHLLDATTIERVFGKDVQLAVNVLTKDSSIPKSMYFKRLVSEGNWIALVCKVADRIHNMRTLEDMPQIKIPEQIAESRDEFPAVFQALSRVIPGQYRHCIGMMEALLWELCDAQERLYELAYSST